MTHKSAATTRGPNPKGQLWMAHVLEFLHYIELQMGGTFSTLPGYPVKANHDLQTKGHFPSFLWTANAVPLG